jgi:hypothetical protein
MSPVRYELGIYIPEDGILLKDCSNFLITETKHRASPYSVNDPELGPYAISNQFQYRDGYKFPNSEICFGFSKIMQEQTSTSNHYFHIIICFSPLKVTSTLHIECSGNKIAK